MYPGDIQVWIYLILGATPQIPTDHMYIFIYTYISLVAFPPEIKKHSELFPQQMFWIYLNLTWPSSPALFLDCPTHFANQCKQLRAATRSMDEPYEKHYG